MSAGEHNRSGADQTRERLIESALNLLIKKGYRGAVTREVAIGAGVTEMTLFRHFHSKEELFTAVVMRKGEEVLTSIPDPSGDLRADLIHISETMVWQLSTNLLQLTRILPEIEEESGMSMHLEHAKDAFKTKLMTLLRHYPFCERALAEHSEEMLFHLFMGPLHMLTLEPRNIDGGFDVQEHVDFFLRGCGLEMDCLNSATAP